MGQLYNQVLFFFNKHNSNFFPCSEFISWEEIWGVYFIALLVLVDIPFLENRFPVIDHIIVQNVFTTFFLFDKSL